MVVSGPPIAFLEHFCIPKKKNTENLGNFFYTIFFSNSKKILTAPRGGQCLAASGDGGEWTPHSVFGTFLHS